MSRIFQGAVLAAGAGLGLTLLGATHVAAASADAGFFDPLLSDAAALCGPSGADRRKLLSYYQQVVAAVQAETKGTKDAAPAVFGASADAPLYDDLGSITFK